MKRLIKRLGTAVALLLSTPIPLPKNLQRAFQYIALGLGLASSLLEEPTEEKKEQDDETAR